MVAWLAGRLLAAARPSEATELLEARKVSVSPQGGHRYALLNEHIQ